MAIASVLVHTFGRTIGTGMWNPLFLVTFPPQFFGAIYGITGLASVPTQYINIPMYDYIDNNDNGFAVMNYIFVPICSTFFALPVIVYILQMKYPEKNRERYYKISASVPTLKNKTVF